MNRAFKFRIYPNSSQQELISKTFGCVRFVHNRMLGEKIEYYNECGQSLRVTPAKYKREFEFLKEVDSLALANAQLNLEIAYRNFFRNKSFGFPKFKSKKNERRSYTTSLVNNNIRIDGGMLILPKLGKVSIKQHRSIPEEYKLKSATVSQSASGKYHVAILYEYDYIVKSKPTENIVGLDFSMKELYISSEDTKPNYPGYYRQSLQKLARLQRSLSKMTKYSNNYRKQRNKIAILHEHIANQRKDFLHKQSRQITNAYDCVAIEDLNMKGMSQALNFGKSVSDNGWGMFVSFLDYKLCEEGKVLIKVDKWFPSSKTCSVCGAIKKELSMSERIYQCDCGNVLDRDVNAAICIKNEALRLLAVA
ncbi:MAG: transposase [Oscillospiraceae bacterium]|nr:transposase [Oscillospiraceae bacterium]